MVEKENINPIALQSKKWIMEALLKLLSEKPYNKITITEIADRAQLGRRTFYRNFNTKEEVLDMYIQELIEEYINLLKEEGILTLHSGAKVYFTFWSMHLDFLKLMQQNNLLYILLEKYNQYLPSIHGEIYKNKKESLDDNTLQYIFTFSAGGFWNMLVKWVQDGAKETPEEMGEILALVLNMEIFNQQTKKL